MQGMAASLEPHHLTAFDPLHTDRADLPRLLPWALRPGGSNSIVGHDHLFQRHKARLRSYNTMAWVCSEETGFNPTPFYPNTGFNELHVQILLRGSSCSFGRSLTTLPVCHLVAAAFTLLLT